jgi:hypothetical protein
MGSLARWMDLVRADAAERYETPAWCSAVVMPLIETNPPRRGGPLCPPARNDI